MKIKLTNEAKTGIMVLICVVALIALVLKVGNFSLLQHGYIVKSQFSFTSGVKKHAPVRLSGVDVGEVRETRIIYGDQTVVELDLWLRDGVKMRKDSTAYVTTLGLMGEKYVEIKCGTAAAEYASAGDIIPSEDPVRLEDLIKTGTKIANDIGKMAQDISKVANSVDQTIQENKPKLNQIFDNLDETSLNFKDFSQDIKFHPWKILAKGKERSKQEMDEITAKERGKVSEMATQVAAPAATKMNFSVKK